MKIKMPFCANMNTGVPWDSGLPFLRALGPAHNRLKTTAGCFVPFEFCTDKNRSDIKCDSVSLEVVAPLDGSRFTVSACFLSFMLSFIISANTSCHIRSMNMRAFSFFSFKTDETTFPRAKHKHNRRVFFFRFLHFFTRGRGTITTFREHWNAVHNNRMSEVIPGLLCCYTHWQKKQNSFISQYRHKLHHTWQVDLPPWREKHLSSVNSLTCEEIGGPDLQLEVKLVVHGVDDLLL